MDMCLHLVITHYIIQSNPPPSFFWLSICLCLYAILHSNFSCTDIIYLVLLFSLIFNWESNKLTTSFHFYISTQVAFHEFVEAIYIFMHFKLHFLIQKHNQLNLLKIQEISQYLYPLKKVSIYIHVHFNHIALMLHCMKINF